MRTRRIEAGFTCTTDGKAAQSQGGMVASAFPDATAIGAAILAEGGNAADAASAVGLALGVCEPQASGLGGQSIGLIHMHGRTVALDGSSRAPSLAHQETLEKGQRRTGYRATTVPSTVATYGWLHRTYGRLPWGTVVEGAARLAREGYRITQLQHELQSRELKRFDRVPSRSGAEYFLKDGTRPYEPGDLFKQPDLALVFEEIARKGPEAFYAGDIAAQIDADMRENDGLLRLEDLALIPWPIERKPLRRRYRTVTINTAPPPAAGRILLLVMLMLEAMDSDFLAGMSLERYHFLAETFRKAFLRRLDRPYDASTYPQVRDKTLLSRNYARELALSIRETIDPTLPLEDFEDIETDTDEGFAGQRGETTHFSVMDGDGNAVSMTQSIELVYGSKAAAGGLGFLYNNYLLAFEDESPAHPYYLRPNAVPWSTAAPTIVFRKGAPWLAIGSPGSERIFSSVAQVLVHLVDGSWPLSDSVDAPRLHCSVGGKLSYEAGRFAPEVTDYLAEEGYALDPREDYAFYLGCVQAVLRCRDGETFQGVADPRRDGTAAGP